MPDWSSLGAPAHLRYSRGGEGGGVWHVTAGRGGHVTARRGLETLQYSALSCVSDAGAGSAFMHQVEVSVHFARIHKTMQDVQRK